MGIVSYFKGIFKRESEPKESAAEGLRTGGAASWLFDSVASGAMSVATVYRCVKFLSESVASLPLQYLSKRGDIFLDCADEPLHYLLNVEPDRNLNAFDFWRQAVQQVLLDGNAYIIPVYEKEAGGIHVSRLVLCSRGSVSHDVLNDLYAVNDIYNGISATYAEPDIIHLKNIAAMDGKRGVGVIAYARQATATALAGDRETQTRFESGGIVRGIVSNGASVRGFGEYQDKELSKTAVNLDDRFHRNRENIVSLPGQVDFKQMSLSSTDMQFLETRKFTVLEICRFFGVHPSFVFSDTSLNYKSAEQANVAFLSHTLNPLLRHIETELQRKLIPRALYGKSQIKFERRSLYACDMDSLMRARLNMLQVGASVNEVRRLDNLVPIPGGDVPLVSANLKSVTELTATPPPYKPSDNNGKQ